MGGYVLGILGFPTYTVARTLDNPYLDRFVNRFRAGTGQHIIPKNGGYQQILDVLAGGGTMTFLADQYAGPKGCWVEFFGRPASAHKAIALLALDNDARVSVCAARRLGRPMQFELHNLATDRPAGSRQFAGHGPRTDPMVHPPAGRTHPRRAGSILVAAPAVEGHAGAEAGEEGRVRI